MEDYLIKLCEEAASKAVGWRRCMHEHPELSFKEVGTTAFIERILRGFDGITVERPLKTGLVAVLKGDLPGKTVAMRADIDALPISEDESLPIRSKVPGVMHACGHDAHAATLLGTAEVLSKIRHTLHGTVKFIFQPAEECPPGGAKDMVACGVLNNVDMIFGMHYHVYEDPGTFLVKPGPLYASTYDMRIELSGKGGHAAFPHSGTDCILLASQIVVGINGIIPRFIDNAKRSVLTVTGITSPMAYNSFPDSVTLIGTMRSLDKDAEALIIRKVTELCQSYARLFEASCSVTFTKGYDLVSSDPVIAAAVRKTLTEEFGEAHVKEPVPLMGGEDFSSYLARVPGCFFRSGTRTVKSDGSVSPPHCSSYEFNDDAILPSVKAQVSVLLNVPGMIS